MEQLSDSQINEIIKEYIEETNGYNYAVMINGEWGSGKTYYANNTLIPFINSNKLNSINYKTLYLSLYGINDIHELSNQIFINIADEVIREKFKNKKVLKKIYDAGKKGKPILQIGKKILADIIPLVSIEKLNLVESFGQLQNMNKYIYFFDDLERCLLPANDILGYINNLVEQNNLKVIILANEKEIGALNYNTNLELKYSVACDENIKIIKNNKDKENYKESLNLSELKDKTKKIFSENYEYKKIKEKLIGKTIYYQKQISEILKGMIEELSGLIFDAIDIDSVYQIIEDEFVECKNIRTLQFALLNINKIASSIIENIVNEDKVSEVKFYNARKNLIKEVIADISRISIHAKNGGKMLEKFCGENYEEDYGFSNLIDDKNIWFIGESKMSFRFNHQLIYNNHFDLAYIKKYANLRYDYLLKEELEKDDPFFKLKYYWEMNQDEVKELYVELMERFFRNYYKSSMFVGILRMTYTLKALGFEVKEPEEIIEKMKEVILKESGDNIMDNTFPPEIIDEQLNSEFLECINILKEEVKKKKNKNIIDEFKVTIIDPERWSSELYDFFSENEDKYYEIGGILSLVPDIDFKENVLKSTAKQFSDLRRVMATAYNSGLISKEKIQDEIKSLGGLKKALELSKPEIEDKIKIYNINLFIEMINKTLENLKK